MLHYPVCVTVPRSHMPGCSVASKLAVWLTQPAWLLPPGLTLYKEPTAAMGMVAAVLAMQACLTLACIIMRPNTHWLLNSLEIGMGLMDITKLGFLLAAYKSLLRQSVSSESIDSLGPGWLAVTRRAASNLMEQLFTLGSLDRACMIVTAVQLVVVVLLGLWVMEVRVAAVAHASIQGCKGKWSGKDRAVPPHQDAGCAPSWQRHAQ
jgi:hypothetical protein